MADLAEGDPFLEMCNHLYTDPAPDILGRVMNSARARFNCLAVGYRLSTYQPMVLSRLKRTEQLTSRYGWPEGFLADWVRQGLAQDFAAHQLHTARTPVRAWTLGDIRHTLHGPMVAAVDFMLAHGICSGISVLVPRTNDDTGSMILVYDRTRADLAHRFASTAPGDLYFLASAVVRALEHSERGSPALMLSSHQIASLRWVKAGKTDEEIADILECSVNTVRYHLKAALKNLGAANRTHAVVLAMQARVI